MYIPTTFSNNVKNIKNDNNKLKTESMLDSNSFCNFITEELVKTLNLKKYNLKSKILVKGISCDTTQIKNYVWLKFQIKINENKEFILKILEKNF